MVNYCVEAQFTGELTKSQLPHATQGAGIAHYSTHHRTLTLRTVLDDNVTTYAEAFEQAKAWVEALPGIADMLASGTLTGPDRLLVETTVARARDWDVIGAGEVAERLGVTTARVRQLQNERPDFPKPKDLAGGKVWLAAEVAEFLQHWERAPGRPRRVASA